MPVLSTQPSYSTPDSVVNLFSGAIKLESDLQHRLNRFVHGQAYTYNLNTNYSFLMQVSV